MSVHQKSERENSLAHGSPQPASETAEQAQRVLPPPPMQLQASSTRLSISQVEEPAEQEAEKTADQVMQQLDDPMATPPPPEEKAPTSYSTPRIQKKAADVQGSENQVSEAFQMNLQRLQGQGRALPPATRFKMESAFGQDLGQVRVHTDAQAAQMSRDINAKAFTLQNDIFFNQSEFQPESRAGQHLLAHELTHVLQQGQGPAQLARTVTSTPVNRKNQTQVFGTAASGGLTLEQFEGYTRSQADWFSESSLTADDRTFLWETLSKATREPQFLAGAGDIRLAELRNLTADQRSDLDTFCLGCHSSTHTVKFRNPRNYNLQQRLDRGSTLFDLHFTIPHEVMEYTISEGQFNQLHNSASLRQKVEQYWTEFSPFLQQTFDAGSTGNGPEFQQILNLLNGVGITPFMPLKGKIRNLHRFTIPTLRKLVRNFANTSNTDPVYLVLMSGHDSTAAFTSDRPLLQQLVNRPNRLVLILEGRESVSGLTTMVQTITSTYGVADASGTKRIAQVMISGHGLSHSVELAGSGGPTVDHDDRDISYASTDISTSDADTQTFVDTVLQSMDPANARVVFNGCLVGSNPIPDHVADADIGTHIQNNPNLKTFVENRARALGLATPANFVQGARASLGSLTSLTDRAGNLSAVSTDQTVYGDAATYAATGHEPEGVMTSAVEVAATNPTLAATQLRARQRQGIDPAEEWWDQTVIILVNVALQGVGAGQPVDLGKVRKLSHMAETLFLSRYGSYGVTPSSFVNNMNNVDSALAGAIYQQVDSRPMTVFRSPPDVDARLMRIVIEQARMNLGANRVASLIQSAGALPRQEAVLLLQGRLDTSILSAQASTIFSSTVSRGLIRLALAWLQLDPNNTDMRNFMTNEVTTTTPVGSSTPVSRVSARVMRESGTLTERDILQGLRLLAATNTSSTGTVTHLANAQGPGSTDNNIFIEPAPESKFVMLSPGQTGHVLDAPQANANRLGTLSSYDSIETSGTTGGFTAFDYNGRLGFIDSSFLI